jgi:hypothetical protein
MGCADTMPRALPSNIPSAADYFFLAARAPELAVTAARTSCFKAASSIFSPSRKSIARRKFRDMDVPQLPQAGNRPVVD